MMVVVTESSTVLNLLKDTTASFANMIEKLFLHLPYEKKLFHNWLKAVEVTHTYTCPHRLVEFGVFEGLAFVLYVYV